MFKTSLPSIVHHQLQGTSPRHPSISISCHIAELSVPSGPGDQRERARPRRRFLSSLLSSSAHFLRHSLSISLFLSRFSYGINWSKSKEKLFLVDGVVCVCVCPLTHILQGQATDRPTRRLGRE